MDNVLPFKKKSSAERHKGKTLCNSGFHKWILVGDKKFDVKQGKLATTYECLRCKKIKTKWL